MATTLKTVKWMGANNTAQAFDCQAFVKETLQKLGKRFDAAGHPQSSGFSNLEHVKMLERGMQEVQSLFADANDPTPAERNARAQVIAEIGVNTSQSRQTFEKAGLLVESKGERKRGVDAMALLDE